MPSDHLRSSGLGGGGGEGGDWQDGQNTHYQKWVEEVGVASMALPGGQSTPDHLHQLETRRGIVQGMFEGKFEPQQDDCMCLPLGLVEGCGGSLGLVEGCGG